MASWSTYSLSDFLLFSPQVYERLFVLHNQDMWPLHILSLAAGALVLALLATRSARAAKNMLLILAASWALVAATFFLGRYQSINWLGSYLAVAAALEAALLLLIALFGRPVLVDRKRNAAAFALGFGSLVIGLFVYPLIAVVFGYGWQASLVFAITPDPTAIATLGGLALLTGRLRYVAAIVPIAWSIFTALTLWTLGRPDAFVPACLMTIALLGMVMQRRRQS